MLRLLRMRPRPVGWVKGDALTPSSFFQNSGAGFLWAKAKVRGGLSQAGLWGEFQATPRTVSLPQTPTALTMPWHSLQVFWCGGKRSQKKLLKAGGYVSARRREKPRQSHVTSRGFSKQRAPSWLLRNTTKPPENRPFTWTWGADAAFSPVPASASPACHYLQLPGTARPFFAAYLAFKRQTLNPLHLKDSPKVVGVFPPGIPKCKDWEKCKVLISIISAQNQLEGQKTLRHRKWFFVYLLTLLS